MLFPCLILVSSFTQVLCKNVSDHQEPSSSCDCCPVCSDLPPMTSTSNSSSWEHKLPSGSLRCWEYFRKSDISWNLGFKFWTSNRSKTKITPFCPCLDDQSPGDWSILQLRVSRHWPSGSPGSTHHSEASPGNLEKSVPNDSNSTVMLRCVQSPAIERLDLNGTLPGDQAKTSNLWYAVPIMHKKSYEGSFVFCYFRLCSARAAKDIGKRHCVDLDIACKGWSINTWLHNTSTTVAQLHSGNI